MDWLTRASRLEDLARRAFPALAAMLLLGAQLLVPPIAGLADNGDFFNVTAPFQIMADPRYEADRYFTHIVPQWVRDTTVPNKWRLVTSEWLLAAPAVLLTRTLFGGDFDLRWMGLIHMLVFALALVVVQPVIARLSRGRQLLLWGALLLIFCDAAYAVHLNTFYMDAGSFVGLLLAAAFYVRLVAMPEPSRLAAVGFLVAAGFFLSSKLQHAYLFPAVVALVLWEPRFGQVLRRRAVRGGALALVLCVVPLFLNAPKDYVVYATYNVVFDDLMRNAADPGEILRHFDLPPELISQRGVNGFAPNSALRDPRYKDLLLARLTHRRLLAYYARRPDEVLRLIGFAFAESSREREKGYGNFAPELGRGPRATTPAYAFYSDLKRFLFYPRPWLYAAFLAAVTLAALRLSWTGAPAVWPGLLALTLMSGFEFGVSALADVAETDRHLFLFRAMQDVMLAGLLGMLLWKTERGALAVKPERPSSRQSG